LLSPQRHIIKEEIVARKGFQQNSAHKNSNNKYHIEKGVDLQIERCKNAYGLAQIIRNNNNLLLSDDVFNALKQKIETLQPNMTPRNISGLLNVLSKQRLNNITKSRCQLIMTTLADIVISQMNTSKYYDGRDLSMIVNALAKVQLKHRKLFIEVAKETILIIDTFNAQDLANTVNAFVKLNYRHPKLFDSVATAAIPIISTFNAQELANIVNAFARVNHPNPELFDSVATAAITIIHTFSAQGLANTVNSFAKVNHRNPELFDTVATATIPIIHTFNAQNLANTVNAFAKVNHRNSELFDKVATATISIIYTFKAQGLANTVNAFAKANHRNPELFQNVATAAIPIIHTFNAQELANTVNAFAKANHRSHELFDEIAAAAIPIINTFTAQELANTVNAFAKVNYPKPELFDSVATAAIPIIHKFSSQGLANMVNAFAKVNHQNSELYDTVAAAAIYIIHTFNAQNLANMVNAFAKVNHQNTKLFDSVAMVSIPIINTFNVQELANTASAFAKVRMIGNETEHLFVKISQALLSMETNLWWNIPERNLVELGYAFLKIGHVNLELLDSIGKAILKKKNTLNLDSHGLGNLAACFSDQEVSSSKEVLSIVFDNIQSLEANVIDLQCIAGISSSILIAQRLNVVSSSMLKFIFDLAISKSSESRTEDVKSILLNLNRIDIPVDSWQKELLLAYKPFVNQYSKDLSKRNLTKILKIYDQSGIILEES